jgi:hypothetical protein
MSSNWKVEEMTTKYWSNPAKFRYWIRKIKQRADLEWSWAVQLMVGTSPMSSDWNLNFENMTTKYLINSAKFRDLIREINKELIGDGDCYVEQWLECLPRGCKKMQAILQIHRLINDGTTIALLDALADPQSNWFEYIFQQSDSHKVV